jgi:hypothetical protein
MGVSASKSELEYESNRRVLISKLPQAGVGAEVGTWKGDFSAQLLESGKPRLLYLIDPWKYRGDAEYEHAMYGAGKRGTGRYG